MKKPSVALPLFSIFIFSLVSAQMKFKLKSPITLRCWSKSLNFEKFTVRYYFSSRSKPFQNISSEEPFQAELLNFDPTQRTTVIIHGFLGNGQGKYEKRLKDSLLKWKDMNVIQVGWEDGCTDYFRYQQSAANTQHVATNIRELFKVLLNHSSYSMGIGPQQWGPVHFIGHSLGAHIAGQAANLLKLHENFLVDRITGLDPAEPCFEDKTMKLRLTRSNAVFVDIIHTDSAPLKNLGFGLIEPIGHSDFYINGGTSQPGCTLLRKGGTLNYINLIFSTLITNGICSHNRAFSIFIESVNQAIGNSCKFWAYPWRLGSDIVETQSSLEKNCKIDQNCAEMGIKAEQYSQCRNNVIYFVPTLGRSPYCGIKS